MILEVLIEYITCKNANMPSTRSGKLFLHLRLPENGLACCKGFEKLSLVQSQGLPCLWDHYGLIRIATIRSGKKLVFGMPAINMGVEVKVVAVKFKKHKTDLCDGLKA
ncbi:hypothetical protein VNO80_06422 [Phaseolus coccineus]|uniref:Uncharacterized protein n=1 Tax=Phaseolus coccineus TaxID=3886 RepID=A0AAN9NLL7_PHACN